MHWQWEAKKCRYITATAVNSTALTVLLLLLSLVLFLLLFVLLLLALMDKWQARVAIAQVTWYSVRLCFFFFAAATACTCSFTLFLCALFFVFVFAFSLRRFLFDFLALFNLHAFPYHFPCAFCCRTTCFCAHSLTLLVCSCVCVWLCASSHFKTECG